MQSALVNQLLPARLLPIRLQTSCRSLARPLSSSSSSSLPSSLWLLQHLNQQPHSLLRSFSTITDTGSCSSTNTMPLCRRIAHNINNNNNNNSSFRRQQEQHRFHSTSATSTPTSSTTSRFAVVDHSEAYEFHVLSGQGRHGQQLALAHLEGLGKDDPPFDPFSDNEDEEEDSDHDSGEDDEDDGDDDKGRRIQTAEVTAVKDTNPNDSKLSLGKRNNLKDNRDFQEDRQNNNRRNDHEEEDDGEDEDDSMMDSDDEDEEEDDDDWEYTRFGCVRRSKAERAILKAGAPAGGLLAIIELAGTQFKVTTDDVLIVNKLPVPPFVVGSTHWLEDNVLLVASSHKTLVGMPHVAGAGVHVLVEEVTKDKKVIIFRKRRRKNWKRKNGFRRDVTMLRILDIRLPTEYAGHNFVERVSPGSLLNNDNAVLP